MVQHCKYCCDVRNEYQGLTFDSRLSRNIFFYLDGIFYRMCIKKVESEVLWIKPWNAIYFKCRRTKIKIDNFLHFCNRLMISYIECRYVWCMQCMPIKSVKIDNFHRMRIEYEKGDKKISHYLISIDKKRSMHSVDIGIRHTKMGTSSFVFRFRLKNRHRRMSSLLKKMLIFPKVTPLP